MTTVFDPVQVGKRTLKNRFAMAPMTRARAPGNAPTAEMARYYGQRAGAGLIVTEGTVVSAEGSGFADCPGIWNDVQVKAWKPVVQAAHDQGAAIFTQIWHVGRMSHVSLQPGGRAPVSSTARPAANSAAFAYREDGTAALIQASEPRALETSEIPRIVEDFAKAAENAVDAGFDGVEIHGANGYLIEQFINGAVNDRTDEYGGQAVESRIRLALEIVDACVARIGADRVAIRLSPFGRLHDLGDFDGEEETILTLAAELGKRQLAYVHLMDQSSRGAKAMPEGFLAKFRAAYDGILILAGGLDKEQAKTLLDQGTIDIAGFGVPFIANPDLVERFRHGWPLTPPDFDTFYGGDERGHTDWLPFPFAKAS
ncbi:alkene reductase [Lutimaribacter marinistellae]|uniref:Alkene reductase n=1 Tax=Lutimaribacter marinistellae TaxID=1820329 RepID=A0ABV7THE9_9RHOB